MTGLSDDVKNACSEQDKKLSTSWFPTPILPS